jgi:hypothetical protein
MTRIATTGRILKNDYPSLLMLMFIGLVWVLPIGGGVFRFLREDRGGDDFEVGSTTIIVFVVTAVAVTIVFGWLASKRIRSIKRIIRTGSEVEGRIQSIGFVKDRGRVEFEYDYDGRTYQGGSAIWKNRETSQLQDGDEVTLVIDPENPSRAFIASLYSRSRR